ncbi:hypothetical protein EXIGLDRAFT_730436 [Exidia glandulosa HHB12029]|uniref:Alkyl transferase n=1 Tax=Exidia glandulosa HHB12029 TaxID=1314781 RepID=A0A165L8D8_EXIGL|nr:hypothetical protein EXIGLDRAFT_730436 [Exidia glandulosa HHB12029]
MDGNRRFARARDRPVGVGHAKGAEIALKVILWWIKTASTSQGGYPSTLTLWAFSSDNFKRGAEEVSGLFSLMESEFKELALTPLVHMFRIRVRIIGSSTARSKFPSSLLHAIDMVETCTAAYGAGLRRSRRDCRGGAQNCGDRGSGGRAQYHSSDLLRAAGCSATSHIRLHALGYPGRGTALYRQALAGTRREGLVARVAEFRIAPAAVWRLEGYE